MANIAALTRQPVTMEWETPQDFFDTLNAEFAFGLDAAASEDNAKCPMYYTKVQNALTAEWDWASTVFCNPPYGTEIGKWVAKGWAEAQKGITVVMLIPARTDTAYWHDYVMHAEEIRIVRGRLRFSGAPSNAPFPSAVIVFKPGEHIPIVSAIGRNGKA